MRIRIAKSWRLLVLAPFLIASAGCVEGCSQTNVGCNSNHDPADDGCIESGGPNSRCSWRPF